MKFNRIIAAILCIVMMSAFACLSVSAITLLPVGNWVYHEINNYKEVEIYEYNGTNSNVFTPYSNNLLPITTVGSNAFNGNTTMNYLTLSKYITTIRSHAFLNCVSLTSVKFQDKTLTTIDDYAFAGCTNLASIKLEDTLVKTISQGVFMNCDGLSEIVLPDTVTTIGKEAFGYCDSLSKIVIPNTVTTIDRDAFINSKKVVIHCYEDSLAHRYAVNNEIDFVLIKEEPTVPETQPTEPPRTYMLGDIDDDGEITVMDATRIQLILVELYKNYTEEDVIRGDVEKDGVLSIMDVTSIQRYSASFDDGLGIGETFEF